MNDRTHLIGTRRPRTALAGKPLARTALLALPLLAVLWSSPAAQAAGLAAGDKAPDITLKSTQGENLRLSEQAGYVRAVLFTARWCGDCGAARELLDELHKRHSKDGFVAWGVDMGSEPAQTRDAARQWQLGYPVLMDSDSRAARRFWIDDMPALFIIDRDGLIREIFEGDAARNRDRIAAALQRVVEE